ncbi:MAG: bifunctional folylpolyglutamate synthase/dihydrofolate synthase [Bacteroidetes bacterium]|nr:bifunctional folylpolyglutamate synthase/dihydrofolate synthase [Bacteroidota bacterium]
MTTSYHEVLDYLFSRLPMFTRIGKAAYKADLDNTKALMSVLQHPEKKFKSIHIAGTNGKGSCSHMLASILQHAGYKTGLYTSPHIKDFRERIRINGKMILEQVVMDFVEKYKQHFEQIQPSFFEWTVALCFDYFANEQVDIAVIETGLGGRLDSTNVITPEVSLITNIGYDHTDLLGETLDKIAFEKAGIIKKNIPVVIGQKHPETQEVFINKANAEDAEICFASDIYEIKNWMIKDDKVVMDVFKQSEPIYHHLICDLPGIYQQKNIPMVIAVVEQMKTLGYQISEQHIRDGIATTKANTGLRGRWDVLQSNPLSIMYS